ncbi:hypothetical protein QEH52_01825 [Coraliomargarita sp. SDUM461003]|uniref:Fibronectin type-III domain-containing protein n=1 Tax=Thalassobacterium maritimum TaxID=3041265 RepID=A0ABU1APX9_9BACT|nr:hypothetical protein [Coraliomargarita sp. SDUM461003]MDQ8206231.1 hypothetical protein [Coraliomargarita sp. SDUM461003]
MRQILLILLLSLLGPSGATLHAQTAAIQVDRTDGSIAGPAVIDWSAPTDSLITWPTTDWADITNTPTTADGYGITLTQDDIPVIGPEEIDLSDDYAFTAALTLDGYAVLTTDTGVQPGDDVSELTNDAGYLTTVAFGDLTGPPTTLSGYGITDAYTQTEADAITDQKATAYAYGRIAWVDPINGSDVSGSVGRIDQPYATVSAARDGLLAEYTPTYADPVTIRTVGAQTIPVSAGLITDDGFILDLLDGSILQCTSGNIITLGSGEHIRILGGGLTAQGGYYAIVNNGGSFELVDSYIIGSFASGSSIIAISHNSVNTGIINRCVVDGQIWSTGTLRITDSNIYGSLQFRAGDHDFEVWDTRIDSTGSVIYGSQIGAIYYPDGGSARTIRGLFRNVYIRSPDVSSYPIVSNFSSDSNTVEIALQRCNAYAGGSKIVQKTGTYDLRLEGDVLYGNLAAIGDGTLDGLAYDGDANRTW